MATSADSQDLVLRLNQVQLDAQKTQPSSDGSERKTSTEKIHAAHALTDASPVAPVPAAPASATSTAHAPSAAPVAPLTAMYNTSAGVHSTSSASDQDRARKEKEAEITRKNEAMLFRVNAILRGPNYDIKLMMNNDARTWRDSFPEVMALLLALKAKIELESEFSREIQDSSLTFSKAFLSTKDDSIASINRLIQFFKHPDFSKHPNLRKYIECPGEIIEEARRGTYGDPNVCGATLPTYGSKDCPRYPMNTPLLWFLETLTLSYNAFWETVIVPNTEGPKPTRRFSLEAGV